MTISSLPADMTAGDVFTATRINEVYDLLRLFRDDRPIIQVQADTTANVATGTTTYFGFGSNPTTWTNTPEINVAHDTTWTIAVGSPGLLTVPEAGVYRSGLHTLWQSNSTGLRQSWLEAGGSEITGTRTITGAVSGNTTRYQAGGLADLTALTGIRVAAFQDSGSTLTITCKVTMEWIQST